MRTNRTRGRARALAGVAALGLLMVLAYACSDNGTGPNGGGDTFGNTTSIDMVNELFDPSVDTVAVGATVTWTNKDDDDSHTVTANDGSFDSGQIAPGGTFQRTFNAIGSYPYYCRNHGSPNAGMHGVIIVK